MQEESFSSTSEIRMTRTMIKGDISYVLPLKDVCGQYGVGGTTPTRRHAIRDALARSVRLPFTSAIRGMCISPCWLPS